MKPDEATTKLLPCPMCGIELVDSAPQYRREHDRKSMWHPMNGCFLEAMTVVCNPHDFARWNTRAVPAGYQVVPVEPTPEMIAAGIDAVVFPASVSDFELAKKAAPLCMSIVKPGTTIDEMAPHISTLIPAYKAMLLAAKDGK